MPRSDNPIQQEARDHLARASRRLRALRGTKAEKVLEWEPFSGCPTDGTLVAKVGKGRLILQPRPNKKGVGYCSSFGPNSDLSFSGYLPGLTLEEAKKLVHHDAAKWWR